MVLRTPFLLNYYLTCLFADTRRAQPRSVSWCFAGADGKEASDLPWPQGKGQCLVLQRSHYCSSLGSILPLGEYAVTGCFGSRLKQARSWDLLDFGENEATSDMQEVASTLTSLPSFNVNSS